MADPFIGEVKLIAWNFPPKGWVFCNGQTLAINQNQALFSLLGTTYGGNGTTTFALPNLQGKVPVHVGTGFSLGQSGGESAHTLLTSEIPSHGHAVIASSAAPNANTPSGNFWASTTGFSPYGSTLNETMSPQALSTVGGGASHDNMAPYLTLNYVIALVGIFPSRN